MCFNLSNKEYVAAAADSDVKRANSRPLHHFNQPLADARRCAWFLTISPPLGGHASGRTSCSGHFNCSFSTFLFNWFQKSSFTVRLLHNPPSPSKVCCGAGLTAVRCESGALFLFGLNGYGQCGTGTESLQEWRPLRALGVLDPNPPAQRLYRTDLPTESITATAAAITVQVFI